MSHLPINKRKILNDPVFGFINLQSDIIFDLIEHEIFQRLRRIKQLGLSCLVYPGANHTRFEHALGALHLMRLAIDSLRFKGIAISDEESEAVCIAILLHDIGHGPFSHALEYTIIHNITHEQLSKILMEELNVVFENKLDMAIQIFNNEYPKRFLHQLVSSQLDMDRIDYLRRDSFFSGVLEGTIGSDRIIKMLNVKNDQLVIEKKGIYSVEKFLIARRLMYWQVYLHKTVIVAEYMLINVLKRAKEVAQKDSSIFAPPHLFWFLKHNIDAENLNFEANKSVLLKNFIALDDSDILSSIKVWCNHPDKILSYLSNAIINRKLLKIKLSDKPFSKKEVDSIKSKAKTTFSVSKSELNYFVFTGSINNSIYEINSDNIIVMLKDGEAVSLEKASDLELGALSKKVTKHFLCFPKEFDLS